MLPEYLNGHSPTASPAREDAFVVPCRPLHAALTAVRSHATPIPGVVVGEPTTLSTSVIPSWSIDITGDRFILFVTNHRFAAIL